MTSEWNPLRASALQWMWQTDAPVAYPTDYNDTMWNYEQGNRRTVLLEFSISIRLSLHLDSLV